MGKQLHAYIDDDTYRELKLLGVNYRYIIKMGIKHIKNRKDNRLDIEENKTDVQKLRKTMLRMQETIHDLNTKIDKMENKKEDEMRTM